MKCLNCGIEFSLKRSSAKYCSGKCKLAYHRKAENVTLNITSETLSPVSVTEPVESESVSVTENAKNPISGESSRQSKNPEFIISDHRNLPFKVECIACSNLSKDEKGRACCEEMASLSHYECFGKLYATRTAPEKLNWVPWMSESELSKARLVANRVSIPGDFDYD